MLSLRKIKQVRKREENGISVDLQKRKNSVNEIFFRFLWVFFPFYEVFSFIFLIFLNKQGTAKNPVVIQKTQFSISIVKIIFSCRNLRRKQFEISSPPCYHIIVDVLQ